MNQLQQDKVSAAELEEVITSIELEFLEHDLINAETACEE